MAKIHLSSSRPSHLVLSFKSLYPVTAHFQSLNRTNPARQSSPASLKKSQLAGRDLMPSLLSIFAGLLHLSGASFCPWLSRYLAPTPDSCLLPPSTTSFRAGYQPPSPLPSPPPASNYLTTPVRANCSHPAYPLLFLGSRMCALVFVCVWLHTQAHLRMMSRIFLASSVPPSVTQVSQLNTEHTALAPTNLASQLAPLGTAPPPRPPSPFKAGVTYRPPRPPSIWRVLGI